MATKNSPRASRKTAVAPTSSDETQNKIMLDELIPTISLIDFPLNLMSSSNGRAKYRFEKYGEKKHIIYEDVLRIIEEYRSFMESGYFVFLDPRVVNRHGLQEIVAKVLGKDSIDKILTGKDNALELFKLASPEQQKLVVGMVTRKLANDPTALDMNLVNNLSLISGANIVENAREMNELSKTRNKSGE